MATVAALVAPAASPLGLASGRQHLRCWRVAAASSSAAASGVDLNLKALGSAIDKKDSEEAKQALDQLKELGWAKRWSSQPYMSRRTTSPRELTTLGIKNAENLAIPSVRNDAAFLFTVVGTTVSWPSSQASYLGIGASFSLLDGKHFADRTGNR